MRQAGDARQDSANAASCLTMLSTPLSKRGDSKNYHAPGAQPLNAVPTRIRYTHSQQVRAVANYGQFGLDSLWPRYIKNIWAYVVTMSYGAAVVG